MSSLYSLKESTLINWAEAVKNKLGRPTYSEQGDPFIEVLEVENIHPEESIIYEYSFEGITKYKIVFEKLDYHAENGLTYVSPVSFTYTVSGGGGGRVEVSKQSIPAEYSYSATKIAITIAGGSKNILDEMRVVIYGLDDNGNQAYEILEKEYKYTPPQLIELIENMNILPEEAFKITGDCSYRFAYNGWNWLIELYGDKITTENIIPTYMFFRNTLSTIPFEINGYKVGSCSLQGMFSECNNLKEVPKINNIKPNNLNNMFSYCYRLEYIPDDYFDSFDFTTISADTSAYGSGNFGYTFAHCQALRKIPSSFLKQENINRYISNSYSLYYSCFNNCTSLDELVNIPVHDKANWTSSAFYYFAPGGRLKRITFAMNEDGSPIVCNAWKNQTIDLIRAGYVPSGDFYNYSTSITINDQVKDDATYQALKNSPNWWTRSLAYSRYNYPSAVETINSLPDVSAGSGNTIKFGINQGLNTDEGPCGNLTEEEIAVAAARGWTVSLG